MQVTPCRALARLMRVHASFVLHAGLPRMEAATACNSSVHSLLVKKKLGSEAAETMKVSHV